MHFYIRKQSKNIVYMELFWICVMLWLQSALKLPTFITYLTDLFLAYALLKCIGKFQNRLNKANAKPFLFIILLMFTATIIGLAVNQSSWLLYIWGLRNNGRFYLFFLCCIVLLDEIDINKIFKMFLVFFWINFGITFFQYVFQDVKGDEAGGIFGNVLGCNAYVNVFLCVVCAYVISNYLTNKIKISVFAAYVMCAFVVAAIAELKIFYVEFLVMLLVAIVAKKPTLKTIGFVIIGILILIAGISVLNRVNPDSLAVLLDDDARNIYLSSEQGYSNMGDLNRFTALAVIWAMFFAGNVFQSLFGFGLGSCDTSSFSFLQSAFYQRYEYLHYRWFSHAWIYLEQGVVGLILCLIFFMGLMLWLVRKKKSILRTDLWFTIFVFVPTCIIGLIYNCALQLEISYIIAFMCAIPFVLIKTQMLNGENAEKNNELHS